MPPTSLTLLSIWCTISDEIISSYSLLIAGSTSLNIQAILCKTAVATIIDSTFDTFKRMPNVKIGNRRFQTPKHLYLQFRVRIWDLLKICSAGFDGLTKGVIKYSFIPYPLSPTITQFKFHHPSTLHAIIQNPLYDNW